ncbi:response regulator transcription factor [Pannus brasiliensis CCIBt3594]|uniref:Response regulator transcription factor n=1 Tax=Pannus brasiliensis CCIBt3594 TaxID=1427578 RepID=A0AAW9QR91_9CHRO
MKDANKDSKKKLLLIDDDPNLILLVKDYLEFKGYVITTAENGREALEILENELPDMIICDVMMPEMDGYTFVKRLREDGRVSRIPVMFLSAKGQSQDKIAGLNTGAVVYMVKPFEPEELVAQVEALLARPIGPPDRYDNIIQVSPNVELTPTELKVVQLVAQGMANKEIAEKLNVSQRTIESHVSNMLNKTSLHNRTELARWAIQNRMA